MIIHIRAEEHYIQRGGESKHIYLAYESQCLCQKQFSMVETYLGCVCTNTADVTQRFGGCDSCQQDPTPQHPALASETPLLSAPELLNGLRPSEIVFSTPHCSVGFCPTISAIKDFHSAKFWPTV